MLRIILMNPEMVSGVNTVLKKFSEVVLQRVNAGLGAKWDH